MPNTTLTKKTLSKYITKNFIETGTNEGNGCLVALECGFEKIYSVEALERWFHLSKDRLKDHKSISLYLGKSEEQLSLILTEVNEQSTFWLDAHLPGDCPILREIQSIAKSEIKNHIILIDDVRQFNTPAHENITIEEIKLEILKINPNYQFSFDAGCIENDVLVAQVL